MGKRKWLALIVLLGAAFITFTVIGKDKSVSDDVLTVEKVEDIVPYFINTTPGLELAIQSGDYLPLKDMPLPDDFKINVDGVWYSRHKVYVFYHVDVSNSEFVLTRNREDLPKIDQLVMDDPSGEASILELVETEEGVLFEDHYYMKGTFQSVAPSETNEPLRNWNGALTTIVSGNRSVKVNVPVSYEYEKETKTTKRINETKRFDETTVSVSLWEEMASESRLILDIDSPFSTIPHMELMISTEEEEIAPLLVEKLNGGQYSASFPAGTKPEAILLDGLIGNFSKEVSFDVDPNQYEIYKQIKESTYTHQLDEQIVSIYGSDVVKETLFYNEDGVTFHLLVNSVASEAPYLNMKYKKQIKIEAVNEKGEIRNPNLLDSEKDRIVFMIDRGFYERSENIQVNITNLPVYVKTDWTINPPTE
ncbi:hypothetical protein GLW07_21920 [Bacillus hwajinpoensis]|uniref:Uncharacterized protein n=1 Tax=Guptibacillus hwajinpoensis TaxID=208199 RepID=A0A845F5A5_9BACL|nr:hypothetical protein [Pseudalkalibacillus hwajinpoensis]MYL66000.1 hypothetical protein [Pseudalkalibacillus hwajinpoensis]